MVRLDRGQVGQVLPNIRHGFCQLAAFLLGHLKPGLMRQSREKPVDFKDRFAQRPYRY
jgi:hypothetical protein